MTEVDQLQELIRSFLRDRFGATGEQAPDWIPAADIEETVDAYVLEVDIRGLPRRVPQIEVGMTLPGDINPDRVDATLRDGVLTVRLGKATASQPCQVEVTD